MGTLVGQGRMGTKSQSWGKVSAEVEHYLWVRNFGEHSFWGAGWVAGKGKWTGSSGFGDGWHLWWGGKKRMCRICVRTAHTATRGALLVSCWRPENLLNLPKDTQLIRDNWGLCQVWDTKKAYIYIFFFGWATRSWSTRATGNTFLLFPCRGLQI